MSARLIAVVGLAAALALPPAAGAGAPSTAAAAPKVRQMVVFRDGHALTKRVSTAATSVRVSGRRCAAGERTPLAALVRSHPGPARFRDFGACSSRARDAAGILVTGIGPDRNRGQRGWVYKVGRRAATAGAGDTGGPFGRGRLLAGQRVTWFYCLRAADCQRTLEVRAKPATGRDRGDRARAMTTTATACPWWAPPSARARSPASPGRTAVCRWRCRPAPTASSPRKDGLVRSFTERVEVP
jgi:hypothetical protein